MGLAAMMANIMSQDKIFAGGQTTVRDGIQSGL